MFLERRFAAEHRFHPWGQTYPSRQYRARLSSDVVPGGRVPRRAARSSGRGPGYLLVAAASILVAGVLVARPLPIRRFPGDPDERRSRLSAL
jgi:hypothetical protein